MGGAALWLWLGCALGLAGIALLRVAWSHRRRSAALNALGWAALAASIAAAWKADGAWGVAVAAIWTMGAAFLFLAAAGMTSRPGRAKASNRRVGLLPEGDEPRRIGGRILTFVIVVFGGLAASIGLAVAIRGAGGVLGWSDANANALSLFAMPIVWAVLATALLMQHRRRSQVTTLLACGLAALPFLMTGTG